MHTAGKADMGEHDLMQMDGNVMQVYRTVRK